MYNANRIAERLSQMYKSQINYQSHYLYFEKPYFYEIHRSNRALSCFAWLCLVRYLVQRRVDK